MTLEACEKLERLNSLFGARIQYVLTLWKHALAPAVERLVDLAGERVILQPDGTLAQLRRVPLPALPYAAAVKYAEAYNAASVKEEEEDAFLRQYFGDDFYDHLVQEGAETARFHLELAEETQRNLLNIPLVILHSLLEWWFAEAGLVFRGRPLRWRSADELRRPLEALFRQAKVPIPTDSSAELLRLLANDIKHHGGRAQRSAARLGIEKGTPIVVSLHDLQEIAESLSSYVQDLTKAAQASIQELSV